MAKFLVVDDDIDLTVVIAGFLTRLNHTVETAADGTSALGMLAVSGFDAIVLDLDLPDINGMEICSRLRSSDNNTPIIMLTGHTSMDDKLTGLDCGADDYLTKPFSLRELSSRLNALVRRTTNTYTPVLKCRDIELDLFNHTVSKGGQELHLLPIDFSLLEFFMRHPKQFFSKEVLLARVWTSDTEATDNAIRSAVKRLRQKLDDESNEEFSIIENNRRVGYRFVGDVKKVAS